MKSVILFLVICIASADRLPIGVRKPVAVKFVCYDDICEKVLVTITDPETGLVKIAFNAVRIQDEQKTLDIKATISCYYSIKEDSSKGEVYWCPRSDENAIEVRLSQPGIHLEVSYDIKFGSYIMVETINDVSKPVDVDGHVCLCLRLNNPEPKPKVDGTVASKDVESESKPDPRNIDLFLTMVVMLMMFVIFLVIYMRLSRFDYERRN